MRTAILKRLNFRHLHYFWVVAREQHLTRAAEKLYVSQSAVSSQIRQLEEELGQALFLREGRSLVLTEVGRLVLGYADGIFNLGVEMMEMVGGSDAGKAHELRVGAVATLSRNFQENLLRPVISDERLRLIIESASLDELVERLRVHKLDVILSNRPVTADAHHPLSCRRIGRQKVCLVGPPRRDAPAFRFPDDLAETPLLLPGYSSEIRSQFDLMCEERGLEPRISAEVDDMAMLRLLARDSGRVAVVPEVVVQDELRQGILEKYCEVEDLFVGVGGLAEPGLNQAFGGGASISTCGETRPSSKNTVPGRRLVRTKAECLASAFVTRPCVFFCWRDMMRNQFIHSRYPACFDSWQPRFLPWLFNPQHRRRSSRCVPGIITGN